jgi:hypothetical protein
MTFLVRLFWQVLRSHHALRLIERSSALLLAVLWPRIASPASARRVAAYGIPACLVIAGEYPFRHFALPSEIPMSFLALEFPLGLALTGVWLALAWRISAMSKVGSAAALCLYLGMRAESVTCLLLEGHQMPLFEVGISALLILMLVNSVRGTSAYRALTLNG